MSVTTTPIAPAATTTPPPATVWPRPLRWTVAMFHAVNATGVFAGRRPMLIRGDILEQGPMNPPHAIALELVVEALRAVFRTGWRFRVQTPLVLSQEIDPFPDVSVVAGGPRDHGSTHPTTASLVVEVSDTTLTADMTEKAELYETAGIQEYWVLDLNARQLHVYRNPAPLPSGLGTTAYQPRSSLGPTDTVSPLAALNSPIRVVGLLP